MSTTMMITLATLLGEVIALIGTLTPIIVSIRKISNGTKCQLRSDMLHIYYTNREAKTIRQYEKENFVLLYEAYKALKGNSFMDDICKEVRTWEVVS